jgi:hypothetical protein
MAETAAWGWPGEQLVRIEALQVLKGIRLGDGPRRVRVLATPRPPRPADPAETALDLQLLPDDQDRPGYRAVLCLGNPPLAVDGLPAPEETLRPFPLGPPESYRRWLFHGPSLQVISEIQGYGAWGIAGMLLPSTPESCLGRRVPGAWVLDPAVVDGSFQLAILWQRAVHDMTPLPSRLRRYRHVGVPADGPLSCRLSARTSVAGHSLVADICLADRTGRVTGALEGMEFSCSRELNRLGGALAALGGRS